ncbi:MAG: hypothetical protein HKP61_12340 [Dactylosporangium sp.]|nr:hypothetical protein [Dactylosporangium sp.]NNJ61708.1 hypothetical protein [Dactylosporangium sp.]
MGQARELKRLLIDQTLRDTTSWVKAVEDQWARAHPGGSAHAPIPAAEVDRYREVVRTEYYEWIEPAFERRLGPDPEACTPVIGELEGIVGRFQGGSDGRGGIAFTSPALSRISDVRTEMSYWQGALQVNFIDNFVTPLQSMSPNHARAAQAAVEIFGMNKILYIRYRRNTLDLLSKAIQAVEALKSSKDPKSYMWGTLLGISIGTVLTLPTFGTGSLGVAAIVASTLAQGLAPEPPATSDLSAPTAQEIAANVYAALGSMDRVLYDGECEVKHAFRDCCDTIATSCSNSIASSTSGPLAVATPAVSRATPADITGGALRPSDR